MGRYEKLLSLEGGQKVVAYFHTSCAPGDARLPCAPVHWRFEIRKGWCSMRRVLVVEDEAAIRVIALNLRMAGYDVTEAGSAEAALAAIDTSATFDVAVLAIMLPGMNGFSCVKISGATVTASALSCLAQNRRRTTRYAAFPLARTTM